MATKKKVTAKRHAGKSVKPAAKRQVLRSPRLTVQPIPDRYPGATPYLCVDGAVAAIEFYKKAFGAVELFRITAPGGTIGHAELRIGKAIIMLSDEWPDYGVRGPRSIGGTPVTISLYFKDVDAIEKRARAAGATITRPAENQFYGDRTAQLEDPFGHRWTIATHIEDVPPREMKKRVAKMFGIQ